MKLFKPRQFQRESPHLFKFGNMSMVYWDLAEESKKAAISEFESGYLYLRFVIPAIIMYCSSVEAFINEQLALQEIDLTIDRCQLQKLKDCNLHEKILGSFNLFAKNQQTEKIDQDTRQNFEALAELRNAFVHFKPDWDASIYDWPKRIQQALQRSKLKPFDPDWTVKLSNKSNRGMGM